MSQSLVEAFLVVSAGYHKLEYQQTDTCTCLLSSTIHTRYKISCWYTNSLTRLDRISSFVVITQTLHVTAHISITSYHEQAMIIASLSCYILCKSAKMSPTLGKVLSWLNQQSGSISVVCSLRNELGLEWRSACPTLWGLCKPCISCIKLPTGPANKMPQVSKQTPKQRCYTCVKVFLWGLSQTLKLDILRILLSHKHFGGAMCADLYNHHGCKSLSRKLAHVWCMPMSLPVSCTAS